MRDRSVIVRAFFLASLLILCGRGAVGTRSARAGQADSAGELAATRQVTSGIIAGQGH